MRGGKIYERHRYARARGGDPHWDASYPENFAGQLIINERLALNEIYYRRKAMDYFNQERKHYGNYRIIR